jgi:hypothetical protein
LGTVERKDVSTSLIELALSEKTSVRAEDAHIGAVRALDAIVKPSLYLNAVVAKNAALGFQGMSGGGARPVERT